MPGVTKNQSLLFLLLFTSFVFLNFVNNVNGGITSKYVRKEWPSVDIPLDNEVFKTPDGHNAPQQVHITQGDYDGTAVIISWVTPDEPAPSKVQYGTSAGHYKFTAEGKMTNYSFYEYKSGYIHHVLVDGLEYDTKYYYKIGSGDVAREFWFQTPPSVGPDVPYTFGIIGDLGQTYNSLSTLEHYMESGAQAVLFLGDLSYADRYKYNDVGIRWDSWGRFVERSTAYQPWMWNVGNHEVEYMPYMNEVVPFKNYLYRYSTPYLASQSSSPLWYAVRRASAHIIVLSSYSPYVKYTPQYIWLKEELARVDREKTPWLIVLMHVPIYNSNEAHFMEGENESAPLYITVGDGGNQEGLAGSFRDPQPPYSAFREAAYGHATLEIKNRTHAFYHWNRNDDGNKVAADSFVLNNQYWSSKVNRRKLEKHHLRSVIGRIAEFEQVTSISGLVA
ncbi:hypothetical protein COLO4_15561 [Corchorus olitorius]|uniref:Purple acid phosphatase n=1 Tax=Corchorus olitorius TaxID=93759 RepID=A0A1R3JMB4_9ROSI|nr:hypothetical protein COLO4_15561 [Corchorus olitorius]